MANGSGPPNVQALAAILDRADRRLDQVTGTLWRRQPGLGPVQSNIRLSSRGLVLAFAAMVLVAIVPRYTELALRKLKFLRSNYRGERIPHSLGIAVLLSSVALLSLDASILPTDAHERIRWIVCITAFGLLGLLDDLAGDKTVKGLRGHVRALLADHRLTTGLIKAAGGLAAAIWVGYTLHKDQPLLTALAAGVIALAANTMNLLDLRPGRAGGVFSFCAVLLTVGAWCRVGTLFVPGLLYVVLPELVLWPRDADARVMLGDSGSNLLGAALGLDVCLYGTLAEQSAVLAGLVFVNVLAERRSLTALIESNTVLRSMDRLTGVR